MEATKGRLYDGRNAQKINHTTHACGTYITPHVGGSKSHTGTLTCPGRELLPCPSQARGRGAAPSFFTLFRGGFEDEWPVFCFAEPSAGSPGPVIRSLLLVHASVTTWHGI